MRTYLAAALVLVAGTALAQTGPAVREPGASSGTVIQQQPNTTGNDGDVVVSRGATGADTATTNSAAGGNAEQPSRALPQGSAGGGGNR